MTSTTEQQAPPHRRGRWIDHWEPENPAFWESTGRPVARRNLWFSIFAEHIRFSVWVLWSVLVLFMGPRHAELLVSDVDDETLIRYIDRFLMFYVRTADRLQRTASWIEGMDGGLDHLHAVLVEGTPRPVPPTPMALLRALVARPGRVVPRADLLGVLGGADEHAVETAIARLRSALGVPDLVQTVVKRAYRLALDPGECG